MASDLNRHLDETQLERYSMSTMGPEETAEFEEHLLLCESCRQRLDAEETFAQSVRAAALELDQARPQPRPLWTWRWAAGFAVAAAVVLAIRVVPIGPVGAPVAVELQVSRGTAAAEAPARTAVVLKPDVAGLPVFDYYRVDLVDASGAVRWQGQIGGARPSATVPGQPAGAYFVRVSSPSGQPLREYALRFGR